MKHANSFLLTADGVAGYSGIMADVTPRGNEGARLLAEVMLKRGWTEQSASERLGVAQASIHRWSTGKGLPSAALRTKLLHHLRIPWTSWDTPIKTETK